VGELQAFTFQVNKKILNPLLFQKLAIYTILAPDSFILKPKHFLLKRFIQIIPLLLLPLLGFSQKKKPWNDPGYDSKALHFGFSVGVNTMDLGIQRSMRSDTVTNPVLIPDVTAVNPGFQVQIVSNLRLGDNLDLRFLPGISFGSRTVSFYNFTDKTFVGKVDVESSYLDFPLDLKYRARRLNNYRPYILGGINYRYDMAARKQDELRLKPGDIYYEMGVGIDWYLPFFKLSTELKAGAGFLDLLVRDSKSNQNYVASISKMNAYVIGLSFHFE
jgi:hypothetical protein